MEKNRLVYLFEKSYKQSLSDQERAELLELSALPENELLVKQLLDAAYATPKEEVGFNIEKGEAILSAIFGAQIPAKPKKRWMPLIAAASVIFAISFSSYFFLHRQVKQRQIVINKHDVGPGNNKAILITRGKQISLADEKSGLLAQQGTTSIIKSADGDLVYSGKSEGKNQPVIYDTLVVPKGGQHQLKLADGTIAWLNSESKLRFPENFSGRERKVELIYGEAYFEVKHNAAMPFKVIVKGQIITDIGTHFNINAYNDEPVIRTVLLEGSVGVTKNGSMTVLKPGQQAITKLGAADITVKTADVEEAIAWKNGYFLFDDESLQSVMRKVSRWYDVEIVYPNDQIINEHFGGSITRYDNMSKVLKMLEVTSNVKFTVEGKRIIVGKK